MGALKGTKRSGKIHFTTKNGEATVYFVDIPLTQDQLRSIAVQIWDWAGRPTGSIRAIK